MEELQDQNINQAVRPKFLTVLCILTFIYSGIMTLSQFAVAIFHETYMGAMSGMMDMFTSNNNAFGQVYAMFMATPRLHFACMGLAYAMALVGAYLMFRLRKMGFSLYALAQVGLVTVPVLTAHYPFDWLGLVFNVTWVLLYFRFYRLMH